MGRIRTIKPDFFKHEGLYDAEVEEGLPLRIAFAGLWTVCDREGRFEWRPRKLKTDVLPYDDVDFSRVLHALTTRGFVVRYTHEGRDYGVVPSFSAHQVINNREKPSEIPSPDEVIENNEETTRQPRVDDASSTRHDPAQAEREGEREYTLTNVSDGQAVDATEIIWSKCLNWLVSQKVAEKQARSMIGKWLSQASPDEVRDAFKEAFKAKTGDPIPYITKILSKADDEFEPGTPAYKARIEAAMREATEGLKIAR